MNKVLAVRQGRRLVADLKETPHGWVQENLQVLEDLIVEQVLKLNVISLLSNSVFCLLPEFAWDVVVSEALAEEH